MTYKQIEACREARLWFTQVIVPTLIVTSVVMANPELKEAITAKFKETKAKIQNKLHK